MSESLCIPMLTKGKLKHNIVKSVGNNNNSDACNLTICISIGLNIIIIMEIDHCFDNSTTVLDFDHKFCNKFDLVLTYYNYICSHNTVTTLYT